MTVAMHSLVAHPFAERFPSLSEPDFAALRDDIAEHGQRVPIVLYDGRILDGVHRARACSEVGIEPRTETFEGDDFDALALVVSLNLKRRHMSKDMLAALGVEAMLDDMRAAAKARQRDHAGTAPNTPASTGGSESTSGEAVEQVAKAVGIGKAKVREADELRKADPDLFEEVAKGDKSLAQATSEVTEKKAEEDPEYAAIVERKREDQAFQALMKALGSVTKMDLDVALAALPRRQQKQIDNARERLAAASDVIARTSDAIDQMRLRRVK